MKIDIKIPKRLLPIWKPMRYKILYGGRASGKSLAIAYFLLTQAMKRKCKILCTREYQSSIKDSTYAVFKALIDMHNLYDYFTVKHDSIVGANGSEFIFKGLARDIYSIKSMYDLDYCFVEEAENIDKNTWNVLIPTMREDGSEILIAFNPKDKQSETYQRFVDNTPKNSIKIKINYNDITNFLSQTILDEIEELRVNNYALYEHIYLGEPLDMTEDVIFKGCFKVENVNIEYNRGKWIKDKEFLTVEYGMDFGFSVDPAAMVECFMLDKNTIYIAREIYEHKLLPSDYKKKIEKHISEYKTWHCDNSRPDTIAELNKLGVKCISADKGKGSVESGIQWLQSKQIIINPSCTNTIYEFYNYRYKTDKKTGNITTDIIDKDNHAIDAIRYAFFKQINATKRKTLRINPNAFTQLGM